MQANIRPDHHYLLVAPNLGGEWLFDAARNYVIAFSPTVLTDFEFLTLTPPNQTVTVTVIARRDTAPQLGVELAQAAPFAFYDPIVRDTFEATKAELDRRAAENQPFGAAIGPPPAPTLPGQPVIPTPWPTTGGPTATPSPTTPATPLPPSDNPPGAIQPTPGSIFGG
jgi:hypothetical protein